MNINIIDRLNSVEVQRTALKERFGLEYNPFPRSGIAIISEADKTIIGNPNPDIYGNIFANITWKNLTLSVNFNYSLGNDVFNYQRSILEGGNNFYNQTVAMVNRLLGRNPKALDNSAGMRTFTDNMNPGAWYYIDIQEAANGHTYTRGADGVESWTAVVK